ncbi:MAG: hypothetical protein MHMPM18_005211 [Marteilia pararefringens]
MLRHCLLTFLDARHSAAEFNTLVLQACDCSCLLVWEHFGFLLIRNRYLSNLGDSTFFSPVLLAYGVCSNDTCSSFDLANSLMFFFSSSIMLLL